MKNFLRVAANIDVIPLLHAVQRQPDLWNQNTLRTAHPGTPHTEVSDIWLRFNELPADEEVARVLDEHESVNYSPMFALPEARPLIFGLMGRVQAERLGRCLITKLPPGKVVTPHVDGGSHAAYYDRYHIVLQAGPGCVFHAGNESVYMAPGEVWWFDNSQEHSVENNSSDDRIHLIVDLRNTQ